MKNDIIPFTEIKKYPLFYASKMFQNSSDNFLMYQYGPYMLMNIDYSKIISNKEKDNLYYKNPILAFMVDISEIVKAIHSNDTIGNIKEKLLNIVTRSQNVSIMNKLYDQNAIIFVQKKKKIVFDIIKKIQDYQYENKSLESALLNYSPIVPYSGTLKKPEMIEPELVNLEYDNIDNLIKEYLRNNIIEIMLHNEDFVSVDNHESEYMLRENETVNSSLSYDILHVYNNNTNISSGVRVYFSLVYLRYAIPKEKFHDAIDILIKINTTYNKIIKGEEVNVMEAVETFSKLSLPPNSSLDQSSPHVLNG